MFRRERRHRPRWPGMRQARSRCRPHQSEGEQVARADLPYFAIDDGGDPFACSNLTRQREIYSRCRAALHAPKRVGNAVGV